MSQLRIIYDEIMADLRAKGFGGYVDSINDYKNNTTSIRTMEQPPKVDIPTSKTKNERPAVGIGGPSSPIEVIS
jgi:hypothetical protein